MSGWTRAAPQVERMLARRLERVAPSDDHAARLLAQARSHNESGREIAEGDPAGGHQLCYDAARKALVAMLAVQGLRPTRVGGHLVVAELATAQLGSRVAWFDVMRRTRNKLEYPDEDESGVGGDDVHDAADRVEGLIVVVASLLNDLEPFPATGEMS